MDPIIKECQYTIQTVGEEVNSFKLGKTELKSTISKLYEENKRLSHELKEAILLNHHVHSEGGFRDLEQKLVAAIAAKESALAMWQEALKQLEEQENLLIGKRSLVESERTEMDRSIEDLKQQYQKGLRTLSAELHKCRDDLMGTKQELSVTSKKLSEANSALTTTQRELKASKKSLEEIAFEKAELEKKVDVLQLSLIEKEELFSNRKAEAESLASENIQLSSMVTDLKEQNKKFKQEMLSLEKEAKESLLAAQAAILQKKEMAYREDEYLKEIKELKASSPVDVQRVELKCNATIKEIHDKNEERIRSLSEEIQLLHKEMGEKQGLFEKAEREKKALQSKLDLLYSEAANQFPNGTAMFDDLCKRLTLAERSRDEYELRIKAIQADLEELRSTSEQEVKSLTLERNTLKERLVSLSRDCDQSLSEKLLVREEMATLKKKYFEMRKEIKSSRTKHAQVLSSLQEDSLRKDQSFKEQLVLMEEHYKSVCSELQSLLENQFQLSNRWKSETEELISKYETKIGELCDEITYLQNRIQELENILQQENKLHEFRKSFGR